VQYTRLRDISSISFFFGGVVQIPIYLICVVGIGLGSGKGDDWSEKEEKNKKESKKHPKNV